MENEVQVRLDGGLAIVVSRGGVTARSIALNAAKATRAQDRTFEFVADKRGKIRCESKVAFRATFVQIRRKLEGAVERGRKAAVKALQAAGYQVG